MKKTRNSAEKGITLIALIITIIIMLILVGVSVQVVINSNLIEKAQDAADRTQTAHGLEGNIGAITVGDKKYESIADYIAGQNIDYVTIYEGEATTTDGIVQISTASLFKNNWKYKIEIESDEYEGTVNAAALYMGEQEGIQGYLLCALAEGEVITFSSLMNAYTQFDEFEESGISYTIIVGMYSDELGSYIMLEGATCEYTITKIEEGSPGIKLFEGEFAVEQDAQLPVSMEPTKKYAVTYEYNGQIYYSETFSWPNYNQRIGFLVADASFEIVMSIFNNKILDTTYEGMVITGIYEIGKSDTYVEENGFGLLGFPGGEKWVLVKTPDTEYIVPSYVGGNPVVEVCGDCMSGIPTFDHEVIITWSDLSNWGVDRIIVTTENYEFIFTDDGYGLLELDLSQCGDNVQIPAEYLEGGTKERNITTIYVNATVKAKYPNNDKVVAK